MPECTDVHQQIMFIRYDGFSTTLTLGICKDPSRRRLTPSRVAQKLNPPAVVLTKARVAKGCEKKGTTKSTKKSFSFPWWSSCSSWFKAFMLLRQPRGRDFTSHHTFPTLRYCKGLRKVPMKRPQTRLLSRTGIVQDPPHREVNARAEGYPCRVSSEQSLYAMAAQRLDLLGQP